jgi:MSHA biogenesis protein MshI
MTSGIFEMMRRRFSKSHGREGWSVVALEAKRLSYVHGRYAAGGKSTISHCASFDSAPGDVEKVRKTLRMDQVSTLLLPGEYQLLQVEAPNVPQLELKSAVRWRIKDMVDYHIQDAAIDVLDIPPEGESGAARNHVMYAIAAKNETVRARIKEFEEARIPLAVIDIPETAQRNIAMLFENKGRGTALLHLGSTTGLLTINYRQEIYLARRMDLGLDHLIGVPAEARENALERILLELQRTFDHFERQFRFVSIDQVLLAPEREPSGVLEHLSANLGIPTRAIRLEERLDFASRTAPDAATQWGLFHLIGASLRHDTAVL